jgi:hypothetical protein
MDTVETFESLGLLGDFVDSIGFYFRFGLIILLIIHIRDILLIKEYFSLRMQVKKNIIKWKDGGIDLEDLHGLSPREFEFWCAEFLTKLGYTNIKQSPMGPDSGVDIVCDHKDEKVYVQCKRYFYGKGAPYVVDSKVCVNLVGAMKAKVCETSANGDNTDKVTKGILITTGIITNDAIQFIRTLPSEYDIELLDGNDIIERYSFLHKYKLRIVTQ